VNNDTPDKPQFNVSRDDDGLNIDIAFPVQWLYLLIPVGILIAYIVFK
jgi:hypothetical protein